MGLEWLDVRPGEAVVSPMFGTAHVVVLALLGLLAAALILSRRALRGVTLANPILRGLSAFVLADQLLLFGLYFVWDYQPFWERFPLHLCAGLSLFVPSCVLLRKLEPLRYVAPWCVGAGFISVVNLSLATNHWYEYVFVHYVWMHFYLFALPSVLVISGQIRLSYRLLWISSGILFCISAVIFALDWALDANWMYIGPHSSLEIPFLPVAFTEWPWSYPTFIGVCLLLFQVVYLCLRPLRPRSAD